MSLVGDKRKRKYTDWKREIVTLKLKYTLNFSRAETYYFVS